MEVKVVKVVEEKAVGEVEEKAVGEVEDAPAVRAALRRSA